MMARPVIAGNWKMNLGPEETRRFFRDFSPVFPNGAEPALLLFPPAVSLAAALEAKPRDLGLDLGVQNIHWEEAGAFTGEISASMALAAGASHVLVGHSERRHVFGETDVEVARKVKAALASGLVPVVCVGETLEERRTGRVEEIILRQLEAFLPAVTQHSGVPVLLAYEPVWAIGTGETATPSDASHAHGVLRGRLSEVLDEDRAAAIPILYGGSVKPGNAPDLLGAPQVDGVLVGGASLDPASFAQIAEAANTLRNR
jgi:triosephosphate isomerase